MVKHLTEEKWRNIFADFPAGSAGLFKKTSDEIKELERLIFLINNLIDA